MLYWEQVSDSDSDEAYHSAHATFAVFHPDFLALNHERGMYWIYRILSSWKGSVQCASWPAWPVFPEIFLPADINTPYTDLYILKFKF